MTKTIKVKRVVGKVDRTPAQKARHAALRKKFQREKPTLEQLVASGDYTKPVPMGEFIAVERLASALRTAREAKRISLADLAKQTGMGKAALSRLESGATNPTLHTISRYAQAVGKRVSIQLADR